MTDDTAKQADPQMEAAMHLRWLLDNDRLIEIRSDRQGVYYQAPPRESFPAPDAAPHAFARRGWRWWLCRHCYAPRSRHPRRGWVRARPLDDNEYLSARAPHFNEGW